MPDEFTYQTVMDATITAMAELGQGEAYRVQMTVARLLNTNVYSASGWERRYATRLSGQVTRALNALAADGELVRHKHYRTLTFYLPEKWAEIEARQSAANALRQRDEQRWETINSTLEQHGFMVPLDRTRAPVLTQGAWDRLLLMLLNYHDPKGCCCQHCPHNGHCRD